MWEHHSTVGKLVETMKMVWARHLDRRDHPASGGRAQRGARWDTKVADFQCAWLLLLYCGVARANFCIRTVRPGLTEEFSRHEEQIWRCAPSPELRQRHHPPVRKQRRRCTRSRSFGAEECDDVAPCRTLGQLGRHHQDGYERHPEVAESIFEAVEARNQAPSIVAINNNVSCRCPQWKLQPLWMKSRTKPRVGWQALASCAVESSL